MKKITYSVLSLIVALVVLSSCSQTYTDLMTADAKTGGILIPTKVFPYKLGSTKTFNIPITVPQGPGVVSIEVYKKYTGKAEVLDQTLTVSSANATADKTVDLTYTYATLSKGLSMPTDESVLAIGDSWIIRYVSIMADGRKVDVGTKSSISVANAYAGDYNVVGYFTHPTPSSSRAISMKKFLQPLTAYSCNIPAGDLGGSGYFVDIVVDPATNNVTFKNGIPVDILGSTTQRSYYEPSTGKFYLHYFYIGGSGPRIIDETYTPVK